MAFTFVNIHLRNPADNHGKCKGKDHHKVLVFSICPEQKTLSSNPHISQKGICLELNLKHFTRRSNLKLFFNFLSSHHKECRSINELGSRGES